MCQLFFMHAYLSLNALFYLATLTAIAVSVALFWIIGYDIRRAPGYLIANWRWIVLYSALILVATHAMLLAPTPPPGSHCVETQHVYGPLEMVLSCDSNHFVASAREPATLLQYESWNQARPLGVMVASILTRVEGVVLKSHYPYGVRLQPGWLPYIILNFLLLLVSLMIFKRLNAPATVTAAAAVAVLSTFLVFSDVVKGFFWSAHTQMWNVLMPLLSIALAYSFLRRPVRSWLFMAATGLLLGIGLLAYGSLIACAVSAVIAIVLGVWINHERPPLPQLAGKLFVFVLAFATPVLTWIAFVTRVTGVFFSPEAKIFRQFVWIGDALKAGELAYQSRAFFIEFSLHLAQVLLPALLLLAIVFFVRIVSPARLRETIKERSHLLIAAGITFAVCLVFFYLMGFYRNRLEFNVALPLLVVASVLLTGVLDRVPRKQTVMTLIALAAVAFITSALLRVTWPY